MLKTCSKCGLSLPLKKFPVNNTKKDGVDYSCRKCRSTYLRSHYLSNKSQYKKRADAQRKKMQELLFSLKDGKSCKDCGRKFPSCAMDFDHKDRKLKLSDVGLLVSWGKETLLKEVGKCDLVCANCHRIRTAKKSGKFRTNLKMWG